MNTVLCLCVMFQVLCIHFCYLVKHVMLTLVSQKLFYRNYCYFYYYFYYWAFSLFLCLWEWSLNLEWKQVVTVLYRNKKHLWEWSLNLEWKQVVTVLYRNKKHLWEWSLNLEWKQVVTVLYRNKKQTNKWKHSQKRPVLVMIVLWKRCKYWRLKRALKNEQPWC